MKKKNYKGFIEPVVDETHYVLGAGLVPQTVLQPNSNWSDSLPVTEKQNARFETYNCTSFNTLNAIEMLMFKQFGQRFNFSDRWVGIIAGTSAEKGGNDPHTVCEAIRKHGLIPEEMLPYSDDLQNAKEYYSFKGANEQACREAGKEWLRQYSFKHEWVFDKSQPLGEKLNNMKVALRYSPLALSVYAWREKNGVYIKEGSENHWTSKFAQTDYSNIFDSYEPFIKKVSQNYSYCKRFSIEKQVTQQEISIFLQILKKLGEWAGLIAKQQAVASPPVPVLVPQPIVEPRGSKLIELALAIKDYEGYIPPGVDPRHPKGTPAWRNKNPGNLRSVRGPFLVFKTYEDGWKALLDYITRVALGKHKAYPKGGETTLKGYFAIYAPSEDRNDPKKYADYVAKRLGVSVEEKIKNLV